MKRDSYNQTSSPDHGKNAAQKRRVASLIFGPLGRLAFEGGWLTMTRLSEPGGRRLADAIL